MPHSLSSLQRQLESAKSNLAARVSAMDEAGVAADVRRRDAKWRGLRSKVNDLEGRVRAVAAVQAREEEVARRKAEKTGGGSGE